MPFRPHGAEYPRDPNFRDVFFSFKIPPQPFHNTDGNGLMKTYLLLVSPCLTCLGTAECRYLWLHFCSLSACLSTPSYTWEFVVFVVCLHFFQEKL